MKALKVIGCVGAALLMAAGCEVDNYVSVEVLAARPIAVDVTDEGLVECTIPEPGITEQVSGAVMDFEEDYTALIQPFEIQNNMPEREQDVGTIDTSGVVLESITISYRGLPGEDGVTAALAGIGGTYPVSISIGSGGDVVLPAITLIPGELGPQIRDAVVSEPGDVEAIIATFEFAGRTNGGLSVGTGRIDFPITVGLESGICDGDVCLCYRW